ncbi:MAG TPA: FAD-dependent oxidoreductase, partial [Candidatus Sulfotelmatobacter sp.]|nr:FAD-dependent oxidoreductase [Candidatus Sulfotelmatobacter sp.]
EIRRADPAGHITIVSDEQVFGYSRAMLPLYIAGKRSRRDLIFAPREFYAERKIRLLRSETAEAVDADGQQVHLTSGKRLPYDRLLVATGSSSRTLNVPGKELAGIYALRKFTDAGGIKQDLRGSRGPVVIIGGGLVGVKSLEALAGKKRDIYLLISSDRILSQMLDRTASDFFLRSFDRSGVRVYFHADVAGFHGEKRLEAVSLSDGTRIACELAIIGKGVSPNVACLKETGVQLSPGVKVDDRMATNVPGIYAAGDVAEPVDVLQRMNLPSTIWPSATEGGRIAGLNMAGVPARFSGALRMNSVEILGIRVISAGAFEGPAPLTLLRPEKPLYRKLLYSAGRLDGFLLLGDVRGAGILTALVKNRSEVSAESLERDLGRGFSYRPRLSALGGAVRAREWGGAAN